MDRATAIACSSAGFVVDSASVLCAAAVVAAAGSLSERKDSSGPGWMIDRTLYTPNTPAPIRISVSRTEKKRGLFFLGAGLAISFIPLSEFGTSVYLL